MNTPAKLHFSFGTAKDWDSFHFRIGGFFIPFSGEKLNNTKYYDFSY